LERDQRPRVPYRRRWVSGDQAAGELVGKVKPDGTEKLYLPSVPGGKPPPNESSPNLELDGARGRVKTWPLGRRERVE
jgi:hypothetical protein